MNEREAREILKVWDNDNGCVEMESLYRAQAYLECFEQMKPLVEALKFCHEAFEKVEDNELMGKYVLNSHGFMVKEALAQWEKVQK